jgi:hypothetical protein
LWEMKRNVSVVCVFSAPNCCGTEQRSASQPAGFGSEWDTPYNNGFIINDIYHNILTQKIEALEINGACSMNGGDEYAKC